VEKLLPSSGDPEADSELPVIAARVSMAELSFVVTVDAAAGPLLVTVVSGTVDVVRAFV
jgi:hypothetical protein